MANKTTQTRSPITDSEEIFSRIRASNDFFNDVEQVAGFTLPLDDHILFSRIWATLRGISNDKSLPDSVRKNCSKIEMHISELQGCLTSLFYHIDNVKHMEKRLNTLIHQYKDNTPAANGGSFNPTLTNRFTFEYHAFAFASVRSVNHVFPALGYICFRNYCPSRNNFLKQSEANTSTFIATVNDILKEHSALESLFKKKGQKGTQDKESIRDLIAHDKFLWAGSLHIEEEMAKLIGILPMDIAHYDEQSESNIYLLSQIMTTQAEHIRQFVMQILVSIESNADILRHPRLPV